MRAFFVCASVVLSLGMFQAMSEDSIAIDRAKPKPLPTPSDTKFNSVVTKTPPVLATAGEALVADGLGKSLWAKVKGTNVDSGAVSSGLVLTADGNGGAQWDIVPVAGGGTGSSVQNFVDLSTNQAAINGNKTFLGKLSVSTAFVVEPRPNNNPNSPNTFIGTGAGAANTTGQSNIFIGTQAGSANSTGNNNVFMGYQAGLSNLAGFNNCFVGLFAGESNTGGSANNFYGGGAGSANTSGNNNNYFGISAGSSGATCSNNSFFGHQAGQNNTASNNTFIGANSGLANTTGVANVYVGSGTGATNTAGQQNSFFGINAGNKTTASNNTFVGAGGGQANTTGDGNTSIGNVSAINITTGSNNTFLGGNTGSSMTVESFNTFVGDSANGAAGITNSTAIGQGSSVTISNAVVLGNNCSVGIGTSAPNSMLQVNGSVSLGYRAVNNVVLAGLTSSDYALIVTGTSATAVGLPNPPVFGRVYAIKNLTNKVITLGPITGTATVDGNASVNIAVGAAVQVISDGTNWFKIN